MSEEAIVWQDPPQNARGRKPAWPARLAPLMARPGDWAQVKLCKTAGTAGATAKFLKSGRLSVPAGRWEFRSAALGDGLGWGVYARFLGI